MSFTVSKLEDGRVRLFYDWAFEQSDKDALELFAELSVQRGEALERERIIKILEANAHGDYRQVMLTPKLLAMISGGK